MDYATEFIGYGLASWLLGWAVSFLSVYLYKRLTDFL